ncbi:DUF4998 domain-containing protein [Flagellimonas onchidii]|uniref:DUF4998 domain-containing protein n=1 Tax=Flagellimonas onchidii TaxID=2562684 RepID=UPI001455F030|nr:DUF4998 domain-containing protein [Allomuricauda onchidii]
MKSNLLALVIIMLGACETTEETYEQFVEGGEDIVVGKPLSIAINPGNQRANFVIEINADPKIEKGSIKWLQADNTSVSEEFDIVRTTGGQETIEIEVSNIDEGIRTFTIAMLDDNGKSSLPTEVSERIYGSVYAEELIPRSVTSVNTLPDGTATVNFSEVIPDGVIETIIEYTDVSGVDQTQVVANDANSATLSSYMGSTTLNVFSLYRPTQDAIDSFNSQTREFEYPRVILAADRTLWSQVSLNNDIIPVKAIWAQLDNIAGTWDGDPNTYGAYAPGTDPGPHFTVSLGLDDPKALEEVSLGPWGGQANEAIIGYEVWGIADITNADTTTDFVTDPDAWRAEMESNGWVKLVETNKSGNENHVVKVTDPTEVNFIRFVALTRSDGTSGLIGWGDLGINIFF